MPRSASKQDELRKRSKLVEFHRFLRELGPEAWALSSPPELRARCASLGIHCEDADVREIVEELEESCGHVFETEAKPQVAVCDFLAYVYHTRPSEQDFSQITDASDCATVIPRIEDRALMLRQYSALVDFMTGRAGDDGCLLGWYDRESKLPSIQLEEASIYQANHWIIEPLTLREDMSYAEIVTSDSKAPSRTWFVSHWWGEAMSSFVKSLAKHVEIRGHGSGRVAYWAAWSALGPGERDTSSEDTGQKTALRAMRGRPVLLLVGPEARALRRAWCILEVASCRGALQVEGQSGNLKKSRGGRSVLDVVALRKDIRSGIPVVLTDGLTDMEQEWETKHRGMGQICKTDREKEFPLEVFSAGIAIDSAECESSVPSGRTWVLEFIAQRSPAGGQSATELVDQSLRSFFAQSALAQFLHRRLSISPFLDTIAAHTAQEELLLPCLSHTLTDPGQFLSNLSPTISRLLQLRHLKLDLGWRSIYANRTISSLTSVADLGSGIRPLVQLEKLSIRLSGCKNLQSLAGLDDSLPQLTNLKQLELQLESCERLQSFSELGKSLGHLVNLTSLECGLGGCRCLVDSDVRELGKGIRNLTKLTRLKVDLSGAKHVFYLTELGRSLRFLRDLRHLELDVSFCTNLTDVSTLGNSMRMLLTETANFQPKSGFVFDLKLEKSGVRINREKVNGYDDPTAFVKSLGARAWHDPDEDDLRPPSPKGRKVVWLTHLEEQEIKRSFQVPLGCQGLFKGCPRLY